MATFRFGKLVRDKGPDWHRTQGHIIVGRRLGGDELKNALIEKLREEADEIEGSSNRGELIEEISDIQQIVNDLCTVMGITQDEIAGAMSKKAAVRGGFLRGEYIDTVTITDENDRLAAYLRRHPAKYPQVVEAL